MFRRTVMHGDCLYSLKFRAHWRGNSCLFIPGMFQGWIAGASLIGGGCDLGGLLM